MARYGLRVVVALVALGGSLSLFADKFVNLSSKDLSSKDSSSKEVSSQDISLNTVLQKADTLANAMAGTKPKISIKKAIMS